MSTIKTTNITHGSNSGTANMVLASDGKVTIPEKKLYCPGAVVQVVFASKTDAGGPWTSSAWADSGLEATITPTASTSKILIQAVPNLSWDNAATKMGTAIFKGSESDPLFRGDVRNSNLRVHSGFYIPVANYTPLPFPMDYLDSPGTTSATTYKVRVYNVNAAGNLYINRPSDVDGTTASELICASTMVLMEIAGV